MIVRASADGVELVNTPETGADLVRLMGLDTTSVLKKSFRVGGPFGVLFCVLMPDEAVRGTEAHRVVGPVTLRGTCLLGRYETDCPHLSDVSVEDLRRLRLA